MSGDSVLRRMPFRLSPDPEVLLRVDTRDGGRIVGHMLEGPPDLLILRPLPHPDGSQPAVRAIPIATISGVATREPRARRHRAFLLASAVAGFALPTLALMLADDRAAVIHPVRLIGTAALGSLAGWVLLLNVRPSETWYRWEEVSVPEFFDGEMAAMVASSPSTASPSRARAR